MDALAEVSSSSPGPSLCTDPSSVLLRKHRIDVFDLSIFLSSSFFFFSFFILLTLIALSTVPVLFLMLLISTSAPLWLNLSTSLSSWPLFCVFDTVLSSFIVSFPSSFPPELISLSQVITFFVLWIPASLLYPVIVVKVPQPQNYLAASLTHLLRVFVMILC